MSFLQITISLGLLVSFALFLSLSDPKTVRLKKLMKRFSDSAMTQIGRGAWAYAKAENSHRTAEFAEKLDPAGRRSTTRFLMKADRNAVPDFGKRAAPRELKEARAGRPFRR